MWSEVVGEHVRCVDSACEKAGWYGGCLREKDTLIRYTSRIGICGSCMSELLASVIRVPPPP
jgi:hypothetical protein